MPPQERNQNIGEGQQTDIPHILNATLQQLVNVVPAVQQLAQKAVAPEPTDPNVVPRRKTEFAYQFLGLLLGRQERDFNSLVQLPENSVWRGHYTDKSTIKFDHLTDVPGAAKAWLRSRSGKEQIINITEGQETPVDTEKIPDAQPIDAIFIIDQDEIPLAIGPCQLPLND